MIDHRPPVELELPRHVASNWKWLLGFGALTFLAGLGALLLPYVASFAANVFIGGCLIFSGVIEGAHAYHVRGRTGLASRIFMSFLAILVGALMILFPAVGVFSITIVMAVYFVVNGVARAWLAFQHRNSYRWGWLMLSGILSLLLGILITVALPTSGLRILGLLVGIDLIFVGAWLLSIGFALKGEGETEAL